MIENLYYYIGTTESITWWQMSIRAFLIFFAALFFVRLGATRIYGKLGSLDIVISVILGSILSRALTGNAPFFATLAAAATLILVHLLLIRLALQSKFIGSLVKGKDIILIENGEINQKGLKKGGMTEHDLHVALRTNGNVDDIGKVKSAVLERNGNVSVIT